MCWSPPAVDRLLAGQQSGVRAAAILGEHLPREKLTAAVEAIEELMRQCRLTG